MEDAGAGRSAWYDLVVLRAWLDVNMPPVLTNQTHAVLDMLIFDYLFG
jgi:hypothetical protein